VTVDLHGLSGRFTESSVSRADQVAARLAEAITKLEPGVRLGTKTNLREQVGVSTGTFNETLRILQSRGLIELRRGPQGGLFTAEQSPMTQLGHAMLKLDTSAASIAEALDLRDALDPMLIADAVEHSSAHQVGLMRDQLRKMADAVEAQDGIAFLHANWKLHAVIAEVSPRSLLKGFYLSLLDLIEQHTIDIASAEERPLVRFHRSRYDVHVRLVDAIEARDLKAAKRALREHNSGIARPAS
jgi:DNA-binding FadR family transcriptional regulator